jgi:hypothetical protein
MKKTPKVKVTLWLQFCGSGSGSFKLDPDLNVSDQFWMFRTGSKCYGLDPDPFQDQDLRLEKMTYLYTFLLIFIKNTSKYVLTILYIKNKFLLKKVFKLNKGTVSQDFFYLQFISSNNSPWAPDSQAKAFWNSASYS